MPIVLNEWINALRRSEVIERVQNDPRSTPEKPLGVTPSVVHNEVVCGGQAEFDEPWNNLSPDDRVLLYAHFLMPGHLEELTEAFRMIFKNPPPEKDFIVVDVGCGPFTGGLAIADVLGSECRLDYIGVDRSCAMRALGERLAGAAERHNDTPQIKRYWHADIATVTWDSAPSWHPVIVIVSYLLASTTLDVEKLATDLDELLNKLGHGCVMVLYTNSASSGANRNFPLLEEALHTMGFETSADDIGKIEIQRRAGAKDRNLKYALFYRPLQNKLVLEGD